MIKTTEERLAAFKKQQAGLKTELTAPYEYFLTLPRDDREALRDFWDKLYLDDLEMDEPQLGAANTLQTLVQAMAILQNAQDEDAAFGQLSAYAFQLLSYLECIKNDESYAHISEMLETEADEAYGDYCRTMQSPIYHENFESVKEMWQAIGRSHNPRETVKELVCSYYGVAVPLAALRDYDLTSARVMTNMEVLGFLDRTSI